VTSDASETFESDESVVTLTEEEQKFLKKGKVS